uniref:Uncharacterized protein n=1 Tax=Brassica campestris TaxID=3711 RepID=M4DE09_BRACM
MSLSAFPVPQIGVPGIRHSTFESLIRFWDSLNFKKDSEFMGITVLFLDEKMWLDKSCYVQGSDFTKETTRFVIRLLIDP